jgi:hypothetical protein
MSNIPVWTTKDGRRIRVTEMSDQHVLNCWKMFDRIIAKEKEALQFFLHPFWGPSPGSMAEMMLEEEFYSEEFSSKSRRRYKWRTIFEKELESRGVPVPNKTVPEGPPEVEVVETGSTGALNYRIARLTKSK